MIQNTRIIIVKMLKYFEYIILTVLLIGVVTASTAPFIPFNDIHQVKSEFQFNLILNENRNTPIIMVQYSEDKTFKILEGIVAGALEEERDIAFAIHVDCRQFYFDLNNSLGVCRGFDKSQQDSWSEDDVSKITDKHMKFDFFSPNPTKIVEKGHIISKNHDNQNLRELGVNINSQFLAKVIRNEVPDFVTYIEDERDLEDFMKTKSEFRLSKGPKVLYFDQNLQAPLFLKKLAVNFDGWAKVGVTDSYKIAAHFKAKFQDLILFEYNFENNQYQANHLHFNPDDNPLRVLLDSQEIKSITSIRKPRDLLLDFEHKYSLVYTFTSLKELNQLLSHGRIIVLEFFDSNVNKCEKLTQSQKQLDVLFNYVCFKSEQSNIAKLLALAGIDPVKNWQESFIFIDTSIKQSKLIGKDLNNLYKALPSAVARQRISTLAEGQLCIKTAKASEKQTIFFYFNDKTHSRSLNLLRYFNSLPEVNSLIYFCQLYLPDEQVTSTYRLKENSLFTFGAIDDYGHVQKLQHSKMQDFNSIKMFLRELSINKMMKVYDEKILKNQIIQLRSAEDLTRNCFSNRCVIGLIQTNTFHQETELKILKEMQISHSQEGYKYFWIDGICHFEVGKQLKLTGKGVKFIDKSYLFLYREKGNQYALFKGSKINKFWDKKNVVRWVKSLKDTTAISRIKFGIDLEDKHCTRQSDKSKHQKRIQKDKEGRPTQATPSRHEVNSNQL